MFPEVCFVFLLGWKPRDDGLGIKTWGHLLPSLRFDSGCSSYSFLLSQSSWPLVTSSALSFFSPDVSNRGREWISGSGLGVPGSHSTRLPLGFA